MRLFLDCIPCFQRQTLFVVKDLDDEKKAAILRKVMLKLHDANWEQNLEKMANGVHNLIRNEMGIMDPYEELKRESNMQAMELYPKLKGILDHTNPNERLFAAAKLAIAGNIIDYGPASGFDLDKTIEDVMNKDLAIDDFHVMAKKVMSSRTLLYFADNAGEIVFDKVFIEEMIISRGKPFDNISFVVKGGPIINDAMMCDVQVVGIDGLPNVDFLEVGNGEKGTGPNRRDDVVKRWIEEHDLVISKGQGNFEGLSDNDGVFFMLMAKCPVIAGEIGANVMDTVIKYQSP